MAEKKNVNAEAEEPVTGPADDGKVDFYAFKDSDKYSGDIYVGINGRGYRIKRGVHVRIPKAVAEVLENSMEQDARTATLIDREGREYERASGRLN